MVVCRSVCFRVVALKARSTYHRVICQESLMQKLWAYLDRELQEGLKQEQKEKLLHLPKESERAFACLCFRKRLVFTEFFLSCQLKLYIMKIIGKVMFVLNLSRFFN